MRRRSFNDGWVFYRDGAATGEPVALPHDAMIHAERSASAPSGGEQGNFAGGTYRYEKRFTWDGAAGAPVLLEFGGVYRHARVELNGALVAECAYGWSPFWADLTAALVRGENLLVVTCDNADQPSSRYYTGAGIHRPVYLWERAGDEAAAAVGEASGTVADEPRSSAVLDPRSIIVETFSYDPPRVHAEVNGPCSPGDVIDFDILDGTDVIATAEGPAAEFKLPRAELWSAEHPKLYTLRVRLYRNNALVDEHFERFGIRLIEWSAEHGLTVNGERTPLRGGCIHADNGILGAAAWPEADRRRVARLKEAGFNALRSAHNPASEATVAACDELGMYLMDETWDQWFDHKTAHDYAGEWREHYLEDADALCVRDRNHPSVIMWSIGNELSEPSKPEGMERLHELVAHIHSCYPGRPVTAGINLTILASAASGHAIYDAENGGAGEGGEASQAGLTSSTFNAFAQAVGFGMNHMADPPSADHAVSPALDALDIAGYNYARGRYRMDGRLHPARVIMGSETLCGDVVKNYRSMQELPYLVGDFIWSAWDYLGEAGCGAWTYGDADRAFQKSYPWLLACQGAYDILGQPNAEALLAQAAWGLARAKPLIAVQPPCYDEPPARAAWRFSNGVPSWSWRGCDGRKAVVEVFSDAPVVELRLNGKSIGRKRPRGCICRWTVRYEPGTLTATALTARGVVLGSNSLVSAEGELRVALTCETERVRPGEIAFVNATVADAAGTPEMCADRLLRARVTGGELLAFGSARPRTEERYDTGEHTSYYGRALAVVRADEHACTSALTIDVEDETGIARLVVPIDR